MTIEHAASGHSIRTYVTTYVVLLLLATVSWIIASFHVPGAVVLGLGIGAIKAVLVLAYFMHLSAEAFSFKLVLMTAVVLVAIFIGLTALDPLTRFHAS
jgi:caa(3)-type oxidase subunit IV